MLTTPKSSPILQAEMPFSNVQHKKWVQVVKALGDPQVTEALARNKIQRLKQTGQLERLRAEVRARQSARMNIES
jgi:hypothetical protein